MEILGITGWQKLCGGEVAVNIWVGFYGYRDIAKMMSEREAVDGNGTL